MTLPSYLDYHSGIATHANTGSLALSGSGKGQATLCVQSAEYRTRSSDIAFLRTVLVWLSTYIPYQLNIVSDYAITQYRTNASDIAHLVRIVCSGLNAEQKSRKLLATTAPDASQHSLDSPFEKRLKYTSDALGLTQLISSTTLVQNSLHNIWDLKEMSWLLSQEENHG